MIIGQTQDGRPVCCGRFLFHHPRNHLMVNEMLAEFRLHQDRIQRAYWLFTRTARAPPPSCAVPESYRRRREIQLQLQLRQLGHHVSL